MADPPEESSAPIDYVEVGRQAYQLLDRHRRDAHLYAWRLAERAKVAGDVEAERFWRAVYASLRPR